MMVTQYKPGPQALNHMSKTRRKPLREQPPPDPLRSTSRYCNLANELSARASEQWAVVRAFCRVKDVWRYTHGHRQRMKRKRLTMAIEIEAIVNAALQHVLDNEVKSFKFW